MALATLTVDLILKAGGFESDMGRAAKTAQKRGKEIEASLKRVGQAATVYLAKEIANAAGFVGRALKSVIDRADELSKAAKTVGMSTESFSRLAYAADLANVSYEELQSGLGRLVKAQAAAMDSNSQQAKTFAALGIAVKDASGAMRPTRDVMLEFADAFKALKGSPEALAAGLQIFGRGFQTFVPLIAEGSQAIRDLERESDQLGATISTEAGAAAEEFNDDIERLKYSLKGTAMQIAQEMLPRLQDMADKLQDVSNRGEAARVVATTFDLIATAADFAHGSVQKLTLAVIGVYNALEVLNTFNPGHFVARMFGGTESTAENLNQASTAFEMLGNHNKDLPAEAKPVEWIMPPAAGSSDGAAMAARLRKALADDEKKGASASKALAEARRAAAKAAREQAEREEQLREAIRKTIEAHAEFRVQLEDLAAARGGEMAQAALQFKRDMEELAKLAAEGEVSAEDLATAESLLAEQYRETTAAIEERLNPGRQVLDDLRFQIELTEMATQAERDRAIFLRENINATADMAQEYADLNAVLDEQREKIEIADQFRSHWEDAFASIFDGTKTIKEAFSDLAASIIADIARIAAKRLVEQLFGGQGTDGGWAGAFASMFSTTSNAKGNAFSMGRVTAFAHGGIVDRPTLFPMARGMGLMGEAGPEAVMPLTRDNQGRLGVRAQGSGMTQVNNYSFREPVTRRTEQQVSQRTGERTQRALARNR